MTLKWIWHKIAFFTPFQEQSDIKNPAVQKVFSQLCISAVRNHWLVLVGCWNGFSIMAAALIRRPELAGALRRGNIDLLTYQHQLLLLLLQILELKQSDMYFWCLLACIYRQMLISDIDLSFHNSCQIIKLIKLQQENKDVWGCIRWIKEKNCPWCFCGKEVAQELKKLSNESLDSTPVDINEEDTFNS